MRYLSYLLFLFLLPSCLLWPQKRSSGGKSQPAKVRVVEQIDTQVFRFNETEALVWDRLLNVLLKNYNLTIVNEDQGIITTEWDRFYLNKAVHRNRLSIRVKKLTWNYSEVTLLNNVERLAGEDLNANPWLPMEDTTGEVKRIVQSMANLLRKKVSPASPHPAEQDSVQFAREF